MKGVLEAWPPEKRPFVVDVDDPQCHPGLFTETRSVRAVVRNAKRLAHAAVLFESQPTIFLYTVCWKICHRFADLFAEWFSPACLLRPEKLEHVQSRVACR